MNLLVARGLFVGAMSVALFLVAYAVASSPTIQASRLGMRGLVRQRALQKNPGWAAVEPIVRWLGLRVSGLLSPEMRARLDEQLALAGDYLGITADEYVGLVLLSTGACGLVGAVAGTGFGNLGLLLVVGLVVGALLPYLQVSGEAQSRLKEISRGLPYAIDLMALGMSAGLDFPGAVRQVVDKSSNPDDPLVVELTRMLQEMGLGRTRKQCLQDFAKRAPTSSVVEFCAAITQAEERGNPVADVLQIQATMSRMRRSAMAEEAAAKAAVKMVGPLMLMFVCIIALIVGPMIIKLSVQPN